MVMSLEVGLVLGLLAAAAVLAAAVLLCSWWHGRRLARAAWVERTIQCMLAQWVERDPSSLELGWLTRLSGVDGTTVLAWCVRAVPHLEQIAAERLRDAVRRSGLLERELAGVRHWSRMRRAQACRTLGRLGQADAVPLLVARLKDPSLAVRRQAIGALADLRAVDAFGAVAQAIEDAGDWDNLLAVMALIRMGPESVGQVGALLEHSRSSAMTKALLQVIGRQGHAADPGAVRVLAAHPDPEIRTEAVRALGTIASDAESVAVCLAAMDDAEWPPRALAAWSLGRLGDERAIPRLAQAMGDTAYWVRHHSAEALAALGDPGEAALRRGLDHANPFVQDMAAQALWMRDLLQGNAA
jgi:HEAT repeat protein